MNYFALTIIRSLLYTVCCCLTQLQQYEQNERLEQDDDSNNSDSQQMTMEMTMTQNNQTTQLNMEAPNTVAPHPFDINTDVLARLADDVSIELMPELIEAFLAEIDTRLDTIKSTPFNENEGIIRTQVHSIKSCARTFGATELADKAAHIEQMIDANVSNIDVQIQHLFTLLPAVHEAFTLYLHKLQQG